MNQTNTEWLRERLLGATRWTYAELVKSEWSERFEQLMRNRLIVGAFRYGLLHWRSKPVWDRIGKAKEKLVAYERTRNKELLVDVANLMLLEFEEGEGCFVAMDDVDHVQTKEEM
jgi:hypothetical protein